jgi:hypothetical protein
MSLFQRLSAGNGTNPFKVALCPRLIPLQPGGGFPLLVEVTCKFCEADVALPGLGFIAATANVPADDSLPVAVSCVDDTKVVASGAPARSTSAPPTNPLPFTVIAMAPAGTDAGAMLVRTGTGFCSVTALLPDAVGSTELTAATATVPELGTVVGAVYTPVELIVPVATLPPAKLFTCQVTEVFDDPVTVALKVCDAPARTFALAGETATVTLDPEGDVLELEGKELFVVPEQPASAAATAIDTKTSACRLVNFFNLFIREHTKSAAPIRRIACDELCLGVSYETTVRRDKIGLGTLEQDETNAYGSALPSKNRDGASYATQFIPEESSIVIRNINRY